MKLRSLIVVFTIHCSLLIAQDTPVVAVLNFTNTTQKFYLDDLRQSIPALLKTELSQKGSLIIVERQKIDALLKEQNFILSDLSEDTAKQTKVGQLLGADYVITGDISEAHGQMRIDVAITKISNGRVVGEKVTGPSKEHTHEMARVLAQNITFQLTGEGRRIQKFSLQGAPTRSFFLSTAGLGIVSGILFSQKKKLLDDYHHAGTVDEVNRNYDRANKTSKAAAFFGSAAAISLGAYIYCLVKNKNSDLEILAESRAPGRMHWALNPYGTDKNIGINFSLEF